MRQDPRRRRRRRRRRCRGAGGGARHRHRHRHGAQHKARVGVEQRRLLRRARELRFATWLHDYYDDYYVPLSRFDAEDFLNFLFFLSFLSFLSESRASSVVAVFLGFDS